MRFSDANSPASGADREQESTSHRATASWGTCGPARALACDSPPAGHRDDERNPDTKMGGGQRSPPLAFTIKRLGTEWQKYLRDRNPTHGADTLCARAKTEIALLKETTL